MLSSALEAFLVFHLSRIKFLLSLTILKNISRQYHIILFSRKWSLILSSQFKENIVWLSSRMKLWYMLFRQFKRCFSSMDITIWINFAVLATAAKAAYYNIFLLSVMVWLLRVAGNIFRFKFPWRDMLKLVVFLY